MVRTIPVGQADGQLADLLRDLGPDDEIVLTEGGRMVARIIPEFATTDIRRPGACKGMLDLLDESEDVIPEHFQPYIPGTCSHDLVAVPS